MPVASAPAPRPVGVTIIGVVTVVLGGLMAFGLAFAALAVMFGAAFFTALFGEFFAPMGAFAGVLAAFIMMILLFAALVAALVIVVGVGVLKGRGWAWGAMIVLMALNALGGLSSLAQRDVGGLFSVLVAGVVIWYFFQPDVKAWFGRS